jgi:hypothetical protein
MPSCPVASIGTGNRSKSDAAGSARRYWSGPLGWGRRRRSALLGPPFLGAAERPVGCLEESDAELIRDPG